MSLYYPEFPWRKVPMDAPGYIEYEYASRQCGYRCSVVKFDDNVRWPLGVRWYVMRRDDQMHPRMEGVQPDARSAFAMAERMARTLRWMTNQKVSFIGDWWAVVPASYPPTMAEAWR